MNDAERQDDLVRDQFTKQAIPFAQKMASTDRTSFPLLRALTQAAREDTVLDVACGPGLVACAFAEVAHLVGEEVHYSYLNLAVVGWKPTENGARGRGA